MRRFLGGLVCLVLLPVSALAMSGRGTTAATFLKIGVGPRAAAMGDAFAAVADDASSVYWNPAGLSQLAMPEVTAMQAFWLQGISLEQLGGAYPLARGVAGASLVYLNNGTLIRSQAGDTPESPDRGTFGAADIAFTGAYALQLTQAMALGGALKLFSESIDASASNGWALDLSFLYRLPWTGWMLGVVAQNLGPATAVQGGYFRLPINFKIGTAYRPWPRLLLALDYNQLLEQNGSIALGAEYEFEKLLTLRAGYQYQSAIDAGEYYSDYGTNTLSGVSAGLGVHYHELRLDYAFVPYGLLGSTHRISLTYSFPRSLEPGAHPAAAPVTLPPLLALPSQPDLHAAAVAAPAATTIPAQTLQMQRQQLETKLLEIDQQITAGKLAKIEFMENTAALEPDAWKTLDDIGTACQGFPELTLRIEGFAGPAGSDADQAKRSGQYADAVKAYLLQQHHLNPAHLQPQGLGAAETPHVRFKVVNPAE